MTGPKASSGGGPDRTLPEWLFWYPNIPFPEGPLTWLEVGGFKSLRERTRLEVKPLTVFAGANSSGKSSAMQPLLLLKQTLESTYDPDGLLLSGAHVRFSRADELLSKVAGSTVDRFEVGLGNDAVHGVRLTFERQGSLDLAPSAMSIRAKGRDLDLEKSLASDELAERLRSLFAADDSRWQGGHARLKLESDGPFLRPVLATEPAGPSSFSLVVGNLQGIFQDLRRYVQHLVQVLHVPAASTPPGRVYPRSGTSRPFRGTFEPYTASLILAWQETKDPRLAELAKALEALGLTWRIEARQLDANSVELKVARQRKRGRAKADLVNIADVGFGTSQVLPVLVALIAAEPGEVVYLEQPEVHLHPRAQSVLADLLAQAASRGVRVIVETHSELLLLGMLTCIAESRIRPEDVILHWFQRNAAGVTEVMSREPNENGSFGDWPEDFSLSQSEANTRYLDALDARDAKRGSSA
jgi:predicted ATPase